MPGAWLGEAAGGLVRHLQFTAHASGKISRVSEVCGECELAEQTRTRPAGRAQATSARHGLSAATDNELVARAQRGDGAAFDLLYSRYQHRVHSLVSRYLATHEDAEDITQEAFIKAYRALPRFRGASAFYTWLYRIAVNTAKNHLASRHQRVQTVDIDAEEADGGEVAAALRDDSGPEDAFRQRELKSAIDAALAALPEDLRVALTLREFNGLSYAQIAEVLACPVGTVRSRIFRARAALNLAIAPLVAPAGGPG